MIFTTLRGYSVDKNPVEIMDPAQPMPQDFELARIITDDRQPLRQSALRQHP
jgi:hypothetical protein